MSRINDESINSDKFGVIQCRICTSEHRKDIDLLLKNKVGYTTISREYYPYLKDAYSNEKSLAESVRTHNIKKHPPSVKDLPVKAAENYKPKVKNTKEGEPMTVEVWAQKLLELGFDPDQLKKVKINNIIAAQKLLIDKEKNKIQEDALKITMARLMSGQFKGTPPPILDGEAKEIK